MTLRDLQEVWESNKIVKIYNAHNDLYSGSLQDLDDDSLLDKRISMIYDASYNDRSADLEISVY